MTLTSVRLSIPPKKESFVDKLMCVFPRKFLIKAGINESLCEKPSVQPERYKLTQNFISLPIV